MLFHVSSEGRLSIAGRRAKPHCAPAARRGRRARLLEARRVVTETWLYCGRAKRALAGRRAAGGERASSGRWRADAPRAASAPRRNRDLAVLRPSQAGAGGPTRRGRRARLVVTETWLYCGRAKRALAARRAAGGECASP
eukprot:tig00020589_g11615.t1